jgi:hypothetical protein
MSASKHPVLSILSKYVEKKKIKQIQRLAPKTPFVGIAMCIIGAWTGAAMLDYALGVKSGVIYAPVEGINSVSGASMSWETLSPKAVLADFQACRPALAKSPLQSFCYHVYSPWQKVVDGREAEVGVLAITHWGLSKGGLPPSLSFLLALTEIGIFRCFRSIVLLQVVWIIM